MVFLAGILTFLRFLLFFSLLFASGMTALGGNGGGMLHMFF